MIRDESPPEELRETFDDICGNRAIGIKLNINTQIDRMSVEMLSPASWRPVHSVKAELNSAVVLDSPINWPPSVQKHENQ